jgi:hypothetical protein
VQAKITSVLAEKKVIVRDTPRPVTPFGGLAVFVEFLNRIGLRQDLEKSMPVEYNSPNAIPPVHTLMAFMFSVLAGARRFAHANLIRADLALHAMLGIERFPGDDTIRNLFRRFRMGNANASFHRFGRRCCHVYHPVPRDTRWISTRQCSSVMANARKEP